MGWFESLGIRKKIVLGYGVLLLLLGGVSAASGVGLVSLERSQQGVVDGKFDPSVELLGARSNLNHLRADVLEVLLAPNAPGTPALIAEITQKQVDFDLKVGAAKTALQGAGDPADIALLAQLDPIWVAYKTTLAEELRLVDQGRVADAMALGQGAQADRLNTLRDTLAQLVSTLRGDATTGLADAKAQVGTTLSELGLMMAGALLLAALLIWLLNRTIAAPVTRTAKALQAMSHGDLGARLDLHRTDEIGVLASSMDQLADTIHAMVGEADRLTRAAAEGRIAVRGDEARFEGAYRTIVKGVNDTLDAVVDPLKVAARHVDRIARGEIPRPITAEYRGDFDLLRSSLNTMTDNLRGLNGDLQSGLSVLAASSTEILVTVSQVAAGAAETATAISQTSTTAEQVRQTAQLTANKARGVQEVAARTETVGDAGRRAVAETLEGMRHISDQMAGIADAVVRLSEQGQAIGEIIATVNDLAEESNMLAVNAAIEATRAGEFGKGFAVVAQEVKSLAEQSRQATTQVRTILSEVQKATSAAVMATEQGSKAVALGVKQAVDAGESIRALVGSVSEASQAAVQIAASSDQQLAGMEQISAALNSIRQATTQNMAGSRQLETSARSLQELGARLKDLVDKQRVE